MRGLLVLFYISIFSFTTFAQKKKDAAGIDSASFYIEKSEFSKALPFLDKQINANPNADLFLTRALTKIELSDFQGAIQDLKQCLNLEDDNDTVYYNLGYIYYLTGDYIESVNYYDSALLLNPDNTYYLTARGDSFLELDNYNLALNDYRKVISLDSEADLGYYGIALCHYYSENYDSARYYLSIAISLDPFDADYFYQRGSCKYILSDDEGAIKDLIMAVDNDPTFIAPMQLLAEIYMENDLYDDALTYLNAALKIDTADLQMMNQRGQILLTTGQYDGALSDFNTIVGSGVIDDAIYYNRGMALYHLEDYQNALYDFNQAISINRSDDNYFIFRALANLALGDSVATFKDFTAAETIDPGNPGLYFNRSRAHFELGHYQQALADLDTAFYLEPEYPGIFLARAEILAALGDNEEALKNYDLAIILNSENGENFFKRGLFLYDNDNLEGALEDFDYAIRLDQSLPAPYVNRGLVKLDLKNKTGACQDWKKAFQLGSEYARELLKKHCQHAGNGR